MADVKYDPKAVIAVITEKLNVSEMSEGAQQGYNELVKETYPKVMHYLDKKGLDPTDKNIEEHKEEIEAFVQKYSLEDLEKGKDITDEKDKDNKKYYSKIFFAVVIAIVVFYIVKKL